MQRVLVIGGGAIGQLFAARLAHNISSSLTKTQSSLMIQEETNEKKRQRATCSEATIGPTSVENSVKSARTPCWVGLVTRRRELVDQIRTQKGILLQEAHPQQQCSCHRQTDNNTLTHNDCLDFASLYTSSYPVKAFQNVEHALNDSMEDVDLVVLAHKQRSGSECR